ncbi:MAG: DUF1697 domain-containing protein [Ignavibacteriae bacterium]|nr:DUF1697 domain-containing protein [Ignavibacteriota bacterium]
MQTYIALLRGINVSGQKKIKMTDLKVYFETLNFENVRTYIQSGNVIFESTKTDATDLAIQIKTEILIQYGFDVPTLVLTSEYLKNILNNNPLGKDKNTDQIYFTILADKPSTENIEKIKKENYLPDEFSILDKVVYLYLSNGYGRTKLNNNFFENKLKVKATTRNWKTLNKILEITNK